MLPWLASFLMSLFISLSHLCSSIFKSLPDNVYNMADPHLELRGGGGALFLLAPLNRGGIPRTPLDRSSRSAIGLAVN